MGDLVFDWYTFAVLLRDKKFSGVSISKSEESMIRILFGLSCVTGTIFSFAMIVAYKYYIKYHRYCMKSARYDRVNYSGDNVWFSPDHTCDKKCNRKYVNLELWISVLELFSRMAFRVEYCFGPTTVHNRRPPAILTGCLSSSRCAALQRI